MARAYQSQPLPDEDDPGDWQSLRQELVSLLDTVDSRVARTRTASNAAPSLSERVQDLRYQVAASDENDNRHRDALRSVQRALTRFEETAGHASQPMPQMPPNPRDSLQAAINQIRARQDNNVPPPRTMQPQPSPAPRGPDMAPLFDKLAQSVNGISGRLERLEGEIKSQIKSGANIKDVADQVSQLAHVVELLAGAVGETGQVKRLEGQIASLGKLMSQGREMDIRSLTQRLDDVASTVGRLAELQVHFADKVENPVQSQAFKDGMASIEQSVRNVYDRIDALERQRVLTPQDLDHVTAEMARFTEAMRDGQQQPVHLVGLVDALNSRLADIENGDKLVHGLRRDLNALRDSVVVSLAPRFDAIEGRIDTLSESVSTRADMAEIGRQLGELSSRIADKPIDPGLGQLEAQVRLLVARMDQTGEQLSGLAKLYAEPTTVNMPDFDAVAELVASRTAQAVQHRQSPSGDLDFDAIADVVATRAAQAVQQSQPQSPDFSMLAEMVAARAAQAVQQYAPAPPMIDTSLADTISGLESRITQMLSSMRRDPEVNAFDGVQAGISEVNERLKRLEGSLLSRGSAAPQDTVRQQDIATLIADAEAAMPAPRARDTMSRGPAEDAPLVVPVYPEPTGPVASALESRNGGRKRHPGLDEDLSLAARYDSKPVPASSPPPGFEPEKIAVPPAPQPSAGFMEASVAAEPMMAPAPSAEPAVPANTSTFVAAARRMAQRQVKPDGGAAKPQVQSNSLIGRAFSRFQTKSEGKLAAAPEQKPQRVLAGDKPARKTYKPEPAVPAAAATEPTVSIEPQIAVDGPKPKAKESFLLRNRKVILMAAAVVALAFLTINLVAQRLGQPEETAPTTATTDPQTTGDIATDAPPLVGAPATDDAISSIPPRVIPMADSMNTGSIDKSAAQAFAPATTQDMPSAFEAATQVANADPAALMPSAEVPTPSPLKVDPPPENIGPKELRDAAANGDPRAQFEVAAIYTEGRAVTQDYKLASTWYERAAVSGFAPAEYRLGSLYEQGQGVTKDLNQARIWYERAAEAGNRMSMHNLAALYAGGQLGKQQFDLAAKWFEEAAKRGMTDSQFNLGMLYARGLGVPQSMGDSFKWFSIAAKSGDKDSAKARDDVARSLDADTVAKLTQEVEAFKPQTVDLVANYAPIGTWAKSFDPGETIATKDIVLSVQKALNRLGYDIGTPDGIAGKKTSDAIKAFEKATGMSEVGQINPRLLAVLGSQPV